MALSLRYAEAGFSLYTSEEFEAMPEFNDNYELIEGRLVKKPMPGYEHGLIADNIRKALLRFDPDEDIGLMLAEVNTKLSPKNIPLPDLSFWMAENEPEFTKGAAPRPDLVVEVLSPHDLETKKRLQEAMDKVRKYQIAGVKIIWVVNPARQEVEVYHHDQIEPVAILAVARNDILSGEKVIPNFSMPLTDLFKRRLSKKKLKDKG